MLFPYDGNEPYIFISYAHKDAGKVLPIVEELMKTGFRVWYDAGIEGGFEWPEFIATKIHNSSCVLAFISPNAVISKNCRNEINFALNKDKPLLAIYLDDFDLPLGMQMQLNTLQAIYFTNPADTEKFFSKLKSNQLLQPALSATQEISADFASDVQSNGPVVVVNTDSDSLAIVTTPPAVETPKTEKNKETAKLWKCTCGKENALEIRKCSCGNWHCSCGKIHPPYESGCTCGLNRWNERQFSSTKHVSKKSEKRPEMYWKCTCGKENALEIRKCSCGNWHCSCGKIHPPYESGCTCGLNRWNERQFSFVKYVSEKNEKKPETHWKCTCGKKNALEIQKCSCGNWRCSCGKLHAPFASSCVCGGRKLV